VLWGVGRDRLTPIDAGVEGRRMRWGGRSPRVRDVQVRCPWMRLENYRIRPRRNRPRGTRCGHRAWTILPTPHGPPAPRRQRAPPASKSAEGSLRESAPRPDPLRQRLGRSDRLERGPDRRSRSGWRRCRPSMPAQHAKRRPIPAARLRPTTELTVPPRMTAGPVPC